MLYFYSGMAFSVFYIDRYFAMLVNRVFDLTGWYNLYYGELFGDVTCYLNIVNKVLDTCSESIKFV